MSNSTSAMVELMAFQRQTEALSAVAERLAWDQETVMPRGAAEQRSEEMAAMEAVLPGIPADWPEGDLGDYLAAVQPGQAFAVPEVLFAKIADADREWWQARFAGLRA